MAAPKGYEPLSASALLRLRSEAEVRCPPFEDRDGAEDKSTECKPMEAPCLFNLREDPCERVNLAAARPQVFTRPWTQPPRDLDLGRLALTPVWSVYNVSANNVIALDSCSPRNCIYTPAY